jgi:hypothetical protein
MSCSCQSKIDDSVLLQGNEYKLWHIVAECNDSLEWTNLDTIKLKSLWTEYKDTVDGEYISDHNKNNEYVLYEKFSKENNIQQWFEKKGKAPEFLYLDRDGYACMMVLNRETGDFVEKQDSEMTGYWKMKNDSAMMINDNRYSISNTGNNTDAIQITNLQTGDKLKITDAADFLPEPNRQKIRWTEENDKAHHKKWGVGIKQSPLLQGDNYKLWRNEENNCRIHCPDCGADFLYEDIDYITRFYYYGEFMYFDRYGRYGYIHLCGDGWRIIQEWRCDDDDESSKPDYRSKSDYLYKWYPEGNDTIVCDDRRFKISYSNKDTLYLRDLETNEDLRYIAVNLPPKSKKFKNR